MGVPPTLYAATYPGLERGYAEGLISRNVHVLEELAALNDHQCQSLGHGMITLRKKALAMLQQRAFIEKDKTSKRISEETAKARPAPEVVGEMTELKAIVADQGKKIDTLIDALTKLAQPPRRGRPKKDQNGSQLDS